MYEYRSATEYQDTFIVALWLIFQDIFLYFFRVELTVLSTVFKVRALSLM